MRAAQIAHVVLSRGDSGVVIHSQMDLGALSTDLAIAARFAPASEDSQHASPSPMPIVATVGCGLFVCTRDSGSCCGGSSAADSFWLAAERLSRGTATVRSAGGCLGIRPSRC
jgi:uncharacterized membrane protein